MTVLVIDEAVRVQIRLAQETARRKPVPLEAMERVARGIPDRPIVKLADRRPTQFKAWAFKVDIPAAYRAVVSYEVHRMGLCQHLSISLVNSHLMPSPEALEAIAAEFGMSLTRSKTWIEEYEPGRHAVNLIAPAT